ncbi:MAG: hypothetical protein ACI87E_002989 [Mariniblastus sp.]|jgi:hypothetical protein
MNHLSTLPPSTTRIACAILACLFSFPNASVAQTSSPHWTFEKGDRYALSLTQTSKSVTTVDARETTLDNETVMEMDWHVTAVDDDGNATIDQSLTRVKLTVAGFTRKKKGDPASPLKDIAFDTAAATNPFTTKDSKTLLQQVQPLIGLEFTVTMSRLGEITDVSIPKTVTEQLEKMPDTQNLRALFSKTGLKEMLGASAMVFPDPLKIGDAWSDESVTKTAFGNFNRNRKYTYAKNSNNDSIAEFELEVTLDPVEAASSDSDSLKSKLLDFYGTGTMQMDLAQGHLKSSIIKNSIQSEKPYREKTIGTKITNQIETVVTKK